MQSNLFLFHKEQWWGRALEDEKTLTLLDLRVQHYGDHKQRSRDTWEGGFPPLLLFDVTTDSTASSSVDGNIKP